MAEKFPKELIITSEVSLRLLATKGAEGSWHLHFIADDREIAADEQQTLWRVAPLVTLHVSTVPPE